jgi:hypothetical protein
MTNDVSGGAEDETTLTHKLLVGLGDPDLEGVVPSVLGGLDELDPVLGPQLADRCAAGAGIGFVPDRDVAVYELGDAGVDVSHDVSFAWESEKCVLGGKATVTRLP